MYKNLLHTARVVTSVPLLNTQNVIAQQTRNTFILKRKYPVWLHKKNFPQRNMRAKDFIYELVEFAETTKKPNVALILTAFVDGIGNRGEQVSVPRDFAYNKLLLPGLATYDTPENRLKYTQDESAKGKEENHSSAHAQRCVNFLENMVVPIPMNQFNPWVLEPWHVRVALRKYMVNVKDDSCIELPAERISGPDSDIQGKEFVVTVTINNCEKAKLRCRVYHYTNDPDERLHYNEDFYNEPAEQLFPESAPPQAPAANTQSTQSPQ